MNPQNTKLGNEVLQQTSDFVKTEAYLPTDELEKGLAGFVIPAMVRSKDVQSSLHNWHPPYGKSIFRRFKNTIQLKLKGLLINILERPFGQQQKFNELTYRAVQELLAENERLKEELAQLKTQAAH